MPLDRLVLAFAGAFILESLVLSQIHHPYWLFFTAFVGANLFQSAFTGFCPWYIRSFRGSMEFRTRIPQWETLWESTLTTPAFFQKFRFFPNFSSIFLDNHFHSR